MTSMIDYTQVSKLLEFFNIFFSKKTKNSYQFRVKGEWNPDF